MYSKGRSALGLGTQTHDDDTANTNNNTNNHNHNSNRNSDNDNNNDNTTSTPSKPNRGSGGQSPEPPAPPHPPRYDRVHKLGRGSFGVVWLCRDNKKDGKEVVAKELFVRDDIERTNALTEASLLSRVRHFNIIGYLDVHTAGPKHVFIYMEFADDGDVEGKIQARQSKNLFFQSCLVMQWVVQLSQAIEYLHSHGFIHRDIKVANLFLNRLGYLKLGDFGIAKALRSNAPTMSARTTRTPVGTPMYISPQICSGEPYNQKSDLWGLGCCVYEICALKPAFFGRSMDQLVSRITKGQHGDEIPFHYSPEVHELIDDLLTVDANARPNIKAILARPMFKTWLEESPATLIAAGKEPKPYAVVTAARENMRNRLAQASAPDFLKINHPRPGPAMQHEKQARPRYEIVTEEKSPRAMRTLSQRPQTQASHTSHTKLSPSLQRAHTLHTPSTSSHLSAAPPRRTSTPEHVLLSNSPEIWSKSRFQVTPREHRARMGSEPIKKISQYHHRRASSDGGMTVFDTHTHDTLDPSNRPTPSTSTATTTTTTSEEQARIDKVGHRKLAALDLRGSPYLSKKSMGLKLSTQPTQPSKLCESRSLNHLVDKPAIANAKSLAELSRYYKDKVVNKDKDVQPSKSH